MRCCVNLSEAMAGHIYEFGQFELDESGKFEHWIPRAVLFVRYKDDDNGMFYEIILANEFDDVDVWDISDYGDYSFDGVEENIVLKEIAFTDLPLFLHYGLKTTLFERIMAGDSLQSKVIPNQTILAQILHRETSGQEKHPDYQDIDHEKCFYIEKRSKPIWEE